MTIYSDYFDLNDLKSDLLLEILDSDQPYYQPERTEFFNYADVDYKPINAKLDDLMQFLSKFGSLNDEQWEDLRYEILYVIEFGQLQEMLEELDCAGIDFKSPKDLDKFMKHYIAAVNHSRLWVNRGHTPDEISKLYAENVHIPIKKVGRNELCPCGSGKK